MAGIQPDYIAKIEGHGVLNIGFKECHARLEVEEGERLFEGLILGRNYNDAPFITARICGICPVAHILSSIKALEAALDIKPNDNIVALRRLMLTAQMLQSHALHLYFLALPDYRPISSSIQLAEKYPKEFQIVTNLKRVADKIQTHIGGRNVHPIAAVVGGFTDIPSKANLEELKKMLEAAIKDAQQTAQIFSKIKWEPEEIHNAIYTASEDAKISIKEGFLTIYRLILGKEKGPRAGYFLSNLEKEFIINRFEEAIK